MTARRSAVIMLMAAAIGFALANSPAQHTFHAVLGAQLGPLSIHEWVVDGLLALFFFQVGLELKTELTTGALRQMRTAALPALAALGGVIVPAAIYLALTDADTAHGWAIPIATDIAFALAVITLVAKSLPTGWRPFVLTLAIVDDIIGICVIAIFYAHGISIFPLCGAVVLVAVGFLVFRKWSHPVLVIAIGVGMWSLALASGIHPTIAAVVLGLVVPTAHTARWLRWLSVPTALVVLPVFAFTASAISLGAGANTQVIIAVCVALVIGKPIGITLATWVGTRWMGLHLPGNLKLADVVALAPVAGVGFTVAMLIGHLAFTDTNVAEQNGASLGVLAGSLLAAVVAICALMLRGRLLAKRGDH